MMVNIKKISENPQPYYLLTVEEGAAFHEKSELRLEKCSACGYLTFISPGKSYFDSSQPLYLDLNTWNGFDLFHVKHLKQKLFCSEKFHELVLGHRLTGFLFEEIETIN